MNKTKMIKTVKKETKYNPANGDASGQYHSGNSLHASGRVRRRTILGEKFDYGEKIKEKQNYVLYQAGQGQEKKEIEEIEELSNQVNKKEKIIEKKEIIDNYQYHETKDIKKKHARNSQTTHKRLCDPFERTTFKKYSSYTSEPKKGGYKIIKTTNIVDKNDYSRDYLHNKNNYQTHLNTYTAKTQVSQNPKRIESNSNTSISSSTTKSYKSPSIRKNSQTININKIPISNGSKINNYSQYERKKVNGIEKIENYRINYEKKKQDLLPQKAINYKYNEDNSNTIPRPKYSNNTSNRITINTSKYSNTNYRQHSSTNRAQSNHSIKLDSKTSQEKSLYEGPKYQLIGKDLPEGKSRPRTVTSSRNRSTQRRVQETSVEKKGYIPFGGKGTKVGGAPVTIPRPSNNRNKIPKPTEERYSSIRVERNTSYTETTTRSSGNITTNVNNTNTYSNYSTLNNNIRSMNDVHRSTSNKRPNPRRNINTRNYQKTSKHSKRTQNYDNKFPGKGTRVGSSGINRSELISEQNNNISYAEYKRYEQNMDNIIIPGRKSENQKCFEQSLCYQGEQNGMLRDLEKCYEENLCYRGENEGMFKEIFCPVHGRQLIRVTDFMN